MKTPFELLIGLTYIRAGRRGRRKDRFMSFISSMSIASIALGVAALIIVLSVMNGFQKEVRDRMLSVIPHIEVLGSRGSFQQWDDLAHTLQSNARVVGVAPFVQGQAMVSTGRTLQGVFLKGIDPRYEGQASDVLSQVRSTQSEPLVAGKWQIILGQYLAEKLRVRRGDKVALMVPEGNISPAGVIPRTKQFTVSGVLSSGHYEYDSTMALIHIEDASKLYRTDGPQGLRVKIQDMYQAPWVAHEIMSTLPRQYWAVDWSQQNRTWFAAVQVEKRMMGIILFLIVVVGAFGLVSSLVMTVKEKQADIAILRTLGASSRSIMMIFILQGAVVGFLGVMTGTLLGLAVAYNVEGIVSTLRYLLGTQFLPQEIYFISSMPSDPRLSDIVPIAIFSMLLSLVATIYPSWRASQIQPAEALRYE